MTGLLSVTADVNGCKFKFATTSKVEADKYKGTVDIVCPSEKSIALTSPCGCTVNFDIKFVAKSNDGR